MSQHHNNRKPFHKNERKNNQEFRQEQVELDEEDRWHPTPEQFGAYQLRDAVHCNNNLRGILAGRPGLTLKELKDSTLHTAQTVEAQINDWLKTGQVVENKGKYSLTPSQGR